MSTWLMSMITTFLHLLFLATITNLGSCQEELDLVQMARAEVMHAMEWSRAISRIHGSDLIDSSTHDASVVALGDCVKLYEDTEPRLARLVSSKDYSHEDALTWLSGALASHRTCLDGLQDKGLLFENNVSQNLTLLLKEALAVHGSNRNWKISTRNEGVKQSLNPNQNGGVLASWNAATSKADLVVTQDGSGNFKTIKEAVIALSRMGRSRPKRAIIYVKSGVYREKVEIGRELKNVMLVGDGMDRTVVTGNDNVQDGASTLSSATFGVSGDGFWARDITFENTAGPQKHQAVALRVSSDFSLFYRCSFKGYQDTLLVLSLRQFYRDCRIYGTIDFIFGDATVVFQNCDILVKRPMDHQSNMVITAQGRVDPNENTGISILNSRVTPAPDLSAVKDGRFKIYLGRPWQKYSRTVFMKTDIDGLIDPKGWTEWSGNFALSTLYYGEYMNLGVGASTGGRVRWPGFHVLDGPREASLFTVRNFIQGNSWIPATGVPFWAEI